MAIEGADQMYSGGDGTALRFFSEPVKNNFQSEKQGRPIFDTVLYVEVMTPGSTESVPKFEVKRTYCAEAGSDAQGNRLVETGPKYTQYREQVEAYERQSGNFAVQGTPLAEWGQIDVGTATTLKAAGIHSVEMLAAVNDSSLHNLGIGGRALRDQARAFINTQQFGVPSAQMAAESANLRDENMRLTQMLNDANERLSQAHAEIVSLRTGQITSGPNPNGNTGATLDPLSQFTTAQPDPNASMDGNKASPLTPIEGDANKGAEQRVNDGGALNFNPPNTPPNAGPSPGTGGAPALI